METQDFNLLSTTRPRPRRQKGVGLAPALLGALCVTATLAALALLYHLG